jgi:glycosyltransferase involved in cell wall biosynthesis
MSPSANVSIVVPVFNAARFLDETIGSVVGQTNRDWELILVDDGSSDNSRAICEAHAALDRRIRVVAQSNRGPAAARNTGVRHAVGHHVMFLDADDRLLPDAIETLMCEVENAGTAMVLGNFSKWQQGKLHAQTATFSPDGISFSGETATLEGEQLLEYVRHFLAIPSNHLVSYCWARLYDREVMERHSLSADEGMRMFEDFAFNLDYMRQTRKIIFVNKAVYVYAMHEDHVSASMAIIDAEQLTHDMTAFKRKIDAFLSDIGATADVARQVTREAGHTLIHYAIIFLVRSCRQLNGDNRRKIVGEIRKLVEAPIVRESLDCYRPRPGNSRLVPWLMRAGLVRPLVLICRWKGNRRYGGLGKASA